MAAACWVGVGVVVACSSTTPQGINCGEGSQDCGGTCTVIARDSQNCGACGKACTSTEICSAGSCVPAAGGCTMGTTKCGNECTNAQTDPRNCGSCGKVCAANEVCMAGACASSCGMGTMKCGMSCIDTKTDRTNCGACGTMCNDGQICSNGMCSASCLAPLVKCNSSSFDGGVPEGGPMGDYCTDPLSDPLNCGGCGQVCSGSQACVAGKCQALAIPCSKAALDYCNSLGGFSVPNGGQAAGGRLYCTKNISTGSDCSTCSDYRMIVWQTNAKPLYCTNFTYSTQIGNVYGGHNPCSCGDNLINCNIQWPMKNCYPD